MGKKRKKKQELLSRMVKNPQPSKAVTCSACGRKQVIPALDGWITCPCGKLLYRHPPS